MKRISHYLKLLTLIPQVHQTQEICKKLFHTKIQKGTQISPKHDDSKEVLPRIRLRDGRHIAYIEKGFPKDKANYKMKRISDYLKLLTFIPQVHQTQKICKSFCHRKVHEGTQISLKHDDSKEILPRIRLGDGRHLAYCERGFRMRKFNILHGLGSTKRLHFPAPQDKLREPAVFYTLCDDSRMAYGKWEFGPMNPMKIRNPLPHKRSSFHIWQG